jgi:HSP20 family molecular chaperone IbpA
MVAMRTVGRHRLPVQARIQETDAQYAIELDVGDFTNTELSVEAVGPVLTIRGHQAEAGGEAKPFRLRKHLEESFRLPDDAALDRIRVFYRHGVLEFRVERAPCAPRRLLIERHRSGLLDPDAEAV